MVGRARQLQEIKALLGPGTAAGRALLLSGEPGVGKSVLLGEVARAMSGVGAQILSAVGVRFEAELAYAGLHQLLLPLNDRFEHLGDTHRKALLGALGYGGDPVPDGLHVCDAVLFLLRRAATERTVFIVVDDLAWLDRASSAVLGFVARRLSGSRIGFLAASRSGAETPFDRAGLAEYELPPLSHDAATELLRARFPELAAPVRDRVLAQAQGNPLALVELPAALSDPQRGALADLPDVLPLSPRVRRLHVPRVAGLPAESRRILLLLALDDTGDSGVLRAGSEELKVLTALAAESDRLITVDGTNRRVAFRHPLMRAAVVETSTLTERCQAHRALAEIRAESPERRAWHLGRATLVPDERIAALLEEAGHRAARRGDATAAVATFTRAAELSPRPVDRGRRLTWAAYLAAEATGELRAASELLDRARRADPDRTGSPLTAATASLLLLNGGDGDVDMAHRLLVEAVGTGIHGHDAEDDAEDDALIEALHILQLVCWSGGRDALWEPFHAALDRLKPAAPPLLSACGKTLADPARTGLAGRQELDSILAGIRNEGDPGQIVRVGAAAVHSDRPAELRDVSWRVVRRGRRGGHVRRHIDALMHLCLQDFPTGRWDEAETLADEGLRVCEERQYPFFSWYFEYHQALLAAVHGHFEESRSLSDRITQWAVPRGVLGAVAFADHARVLAELGAGDYECAYRHAVAISPAGRLASHAPQALSVCMDLVEAAVHTRRAAEAEAHVQAMREAGVAALSPRLALLVAGSAALVAPDDGAVGRFEQALSVPGAQHWPFDLARIRLAYGERLRRMRFVSEARAQLDAANQVFERLGAQPWADRAAGELRATRRSRTAAKHGSATLTAQEQEIATLAASGMTNKQIGERLHLSPRTVGSHLYQLFPKLGIASRAAIRDALASLPPSAAF
ncbi:AAA family ATPase [Streptomyces sp. NBC_01275]|uniref:helix-turn-helix transcriptional regulator n=1 Tax=Streptomyces sp. NBC_01275 TaxID=2903807 RepID=UPI0022561F0E|nr:LuxR family transcriptional regulator [Streptomyces sp. NBC_01275]MCX4766756.1 AAA family ATPase [Streptomyces sp. NBC_01275]